MFETIKCNKRIYIERNFEPLTLDTIENDIELGK